MKRMTFVGHYVDRHGKRRWRFRRNGKTISLPGEPGQPEFEAAYNSAISGQAATPPRQEIRLRAFHEAFCARALARARSRAALKGVPFEIDEHIVLQILRSQSWRCAISGIAFDLLRPTDLSAPFRPSLDRIVPANGYVADNTRVVCEIVNLAMHDWGSEPLFALADAMARRPRQT